jgi:carbon-monoxide dehydrogenase iron sulfur subunit
MVPLGAIPTPIVSPMRRLTVREDACIGCHLCEIWCVVAHSDSENPVDCYNLDDTRPLPRVRVEENKPASFPLQCRQCSEPLCVFSCPSGAMSRGVDGVIQVDRDRCQGCWICLLVCPFGAVTRGDGHAVKCDLCPSRDTPACVEHCPNEAIIFEEVDG